ncbi:MAG TPA: hypothetical protein VMT52_00960, partial [Planctomycetota bacterium]|nr:hypothetical protein [Planctomycetota bacterium]
RLTTSAGDIEIHDGALVLQQQAQTFPGIGVDVGPGETRRIAGAITVDFLRVQAGGTLALTENTFIIVRGNVLIAGVIDGRGDRRTIDGRDLTIQQLVDGDGATDEGIIITGTIDCGGFTKDIDDTAVAARGDFPGGNGGAIFLSSSNDGMANPQTSAQIFISGRVLADGGETSSQSPLTALPGRGGKVLIGSRGSLGLSGRISARGGRAFISADGNEGLGGQIELVALNDIEIARVLEINASGGASSGPAGGDGGSILLEAPVGLIDLDNFDIENLGGRSLNSATGVGGRGGLVTLTGATVNLDNVIVRVSGGETTRADAGVGGDGGTLQIANTTAMSISQSSRLFSEGGRTRLLGSPGGSGGAIKLINLDEASAVALHFRGEASVRGGYNALGSDGPEGVICVSGSNLDSDLQLVGTNNFPLSNCTEGDLTETVLHDLDCDDGTIVPSSVSTSVPVILNLDFYRILITPGMVAEPFTMITVSTTGEEGGNIDLFLGPDTALGSSDPLDYPFASTGPDSTEEIADFDFNAAGLSAGDFLSVMVRESSTFVEDYTITVACSGPP